MKDMAIPPMSDSDRYRALGVPYHPTKLVCDGPCEGTGWVPVYMVEGNPRRHEPQALSGPDEDDPRLVALWREKQVEEPSEDGYQFVKCPDCSGTGLFGSPKNASPADHREDA